MPPWSTRAWPLLGLALCVSMGCGSQGDDWIAHPAAIPSDDADEPSESMPRAGGGIEIDRVQANQGVGLIIGAEGAALSPEQRAAPLVRGRPTLVQAYWSLPDDWRPRQIEGRLTITQPDGTEAVTTHTTWVEDGPTAAGPSRSFAWSLMSGKVQPGAEYRVELFETSLDHTDLREPSPRSRLPEAGGDAPLHVRADDLVMKVMLVPVHYDDGAGCRTEPDVSEATMQGFVDALYMRNPLGRVDLQLHAPVAWNTPLQSFVPLNTHLAGMRFDEGAPAETYYYGLIDVCDDGLGGAGGMAIAVPDDPLDPSSAALRVASGLSRTPTWSAETFVHELGHAQGRHHVACSGDEKAPDPLYPHEGGDLDEWGFDVVDFDLKNPKSHKDYMSYCQPAWVGAWGWNEVFPVIEELSRWSTTAARHGSAPDDDPYGGSMLLGTLEPDGAEHWITVPGQVPVAALNPTTHLELHHGDTMLSRIAAYTQPLPDGEGTLVLAPLPPQWSTATTVTRVTHGRRSVIAAASIDEHHRAPGFDR